MLQVRGREGAGEDLSDSVNYPSPRSYIINFVKIGQVDLEKMLIDDA